MCINQYVIKKKAGARMTDVKVLTPYIKLCEERMQLCLVAHACNPSFQEDVRQEDYHEFEAYLGYIVN